jgi:phosphotriesterase-related protein
VSFVRTILGDVSATGLGLCDAHEHVAMSSPWLRGHHPEFVTDDLTKEAADLVAFRKAGGGWVIDAAPGGAGRDARAAADLSRATGVRIVVATGLHLEKYYDPDDPRLTAGADELADTFMREIEQQLDDSAGRAGIIKVAGGLDGLDDRQAEAFAAAGVASAETGCPILTHCEQGTGGLEQIEAIVDAGGDPSRIVLSHCDRVNDAGYHRDLLSAGATLEYDGHFRGFESAKLAAELAPAFPKQIVLGMDLARRSYWRGHGGTPGLAWLVTELPDQLIKAGVPPESVTRMLDQNPARAFAFQGRVAAAHADAAEAAEEE